MTEPDTQHEAAIERVVQNLSDEDQRIGLVGFRLTDDQVREIARVVLAAAYDAARSGDQLDAAKAEVSRRAPRGVVFSDAQAEWIALGALAAARAARSGEAEGRDIAIDFLATVAAPAGRLSLTNPPPTADEVHSDADLIVRACRTARDAICGTPFVAVAQHPEPRQDQSIPTTAELAERHWSEEEDRRDAALEAHRARQDQPVNRASGEKTCRCGHADYVHDNDVHGTRSCNADNCACKREIVEYPETGEREDRELLQRALDYVDVEALREDADEAGRLETDLWEVADALGLETIPGEPRLPERVAAIVAEVERLREALRSIASCQSNHPADVVSVARAALTLSPDDRGGER